MCVCACVCMCACVVVCFLLFILKPAFIHRIGCFDWQRHRRVNALLVMQLKSVKPQTPALFSDAYFIIAPLSPFLPGVEALLCMRLIFILLITLLHVYLGVASTVFNVFYQHWPASELICSQVWSGLQSRRLDFLSLVWPSSLLHWWQANKDLSHQSEAGSLSSQISTDTALNPFICKWGLNQEILTDLPPTLCCLLVILHF